MQCFLSRSLHKQFSNERTEEVRKRQLADRERRRAKEQVLVQRIEQKERELVEMKKKQEEDVERNQRAIAERLV